MTTTPLKGRVAIITGATAGIGLAIAHDFARLGAALVLNGRRGERLDAIANELPTTCANVAGDCADDATIRAMLDAGRTLALGRAPDLVVINAGRGLRGSVLDSDTAQWEDMIRTNLLAAAKLLRESAKSMLADIEKPHGTNSGAKALASPRDIVVLGSTVGRHISPFSSMYGSTKFAANSLAEAARRELGPKGIRVTLIEPGFVVSEFQGVAGYDPSWFESIKDRIGPPLTPDDVARSVSFVVTQPPAVHVSDVLIRPTRQDYP